MNLKNGLKNRILVISILTLVCLGVIGVQKLHAKLFENNGYFKLLPMTIEPRQGHTATLLEDGRVLITGGRINGKSILKSAEIYDPKINKFIKTDNMTEPRVNHSAILLQDGRVLITGGCFSNKNLKSAEIYDPKINRFTKTPDMNNAWDNHNMILFNDGRVLISHRSPILEIFNPKNNEFKTTVSCLSKRCPENSILLNNGTVLLASGYDFINKTHYTPQVFAPQMDTIKKTGQMSLGRSFSTISLLKNNEVIIIGGRNNYNDIAQSEIYNVNAGNFKLAAKLNQARHGHSSITLQNGNILIVGGASGHSTTLQYLKSAELYNPQMDKFIKIDDMNFSRFEPTLTPLHNGNILILGDGKKPELYITK